MKKTVDNGPVAYRRGIIIGCVISWFVCKHFPEDASWRQQVLLGLVIGLIIYIAPVIWIPSPEKTEKSNGKKND